MSVQDEPFLVMVANLARFHREHEKFYAESPLHDAITLRRGARTLQALAERWTVAEPLVVAGSGIPFTGALDLNDDRATETLGVLFMEGQGEPAELTRLTHDLTALAVAYRATGQWLAAAMDTAWEYAEALLDLPDLADLLGERHRIIDNDAQAAGEALLVARNVERAVLVLARVDFDPAALRADLAGGRQSPRYLFSASELLGHAADLAAHSAVLTQDNERRWRVFSQRVGELAGR